MRIAIAGGGPGGLYLSILLKRLDPSHEVVVHERNAPDDTFGFGVVFSDETLAAFEAADPESYAQIAASFVRWSEIDVHYRGEVVTSGGHGFSAMGRKELLGILQRRATSLGVDLRFHSEVTELDGDLVVAADGVNSTLRSTLRLRARARPPPRDVRLVRHRPRVQGLHVHHRRDAAGRRAGARVPVLAAPARRSSSRAAGWSSTRRSARTCSATA